MANAHPVRIKTDDGWQDLALTGPQGPQGIPGPTGATGPAGAPGTPVLPTPIVNGRWLKGVGGAAVWSPAHYFNSSVDASASNVDIPWNGGEAIIANLALQGGSTSGSIRSVAAPNSGNGTRLVLYNDIPTGKTTTILHSTIGGSGSTLRTRDKVSLVLNPGESVEFIYQYDAFWVEVSRDMHISDQDVPSLASGGRLAASSKPIPGNDCNQALENGWYYIHTTAPVNGPPSPTGWSILEVVDMNVNSNIRQRAFDYITEAIWMRRRQDGNWGPWYQVYPTPIGTTLPTSPVDGQEAILVDNVSNALYQWRFRYNASNTSAYKWEFVGGAPASRPVSLPGGGSAMTPDGVWTDFANSITVSRAGIYIVEGGYFCYLPTTGAVAFVGPGVNGGNAGNFGTASAWAVNAQMGVQISGPWPIAIAAGSVVTLQWWKNGGGSGVFEGGSFALTPTRVA